MPSIPPGWVSCRVEDIASSAKNALVGGPFGSNLVSSDYVPVGVPVIRGQNMGPGRWVAGQFAHVSSSKADELAANTAVPGDLVFTQRGTLGQVAIVPDDGHARYIVSQSQMKLSVEPRKSDPLFLYYLFISPQQQDYVLRNAIQTGVPHTNLGHLRTTPLLLPPLDEQRSIARILGALDDKIELSRKTNETNEAMARALFKSWFIDFDPVRAKMEGRRPEGMDVETAALFPDVFEESVLGPVPKGWRVVSLGDCVRLQRGTTYKSALLDQPGPYLLGLASIQRNGGFRSDSLRTYGGESPGKLLLRGGDIYVSLKDVTQAGDLLGAVARVPRWLGTGRVTQDTVKLEFADPSVPPELVYRLLLTSPVREHFRSRATGTTNLALSREDFLGLQFVVPPPREATVLVSHLEALSDRSEHLNESGTLRAIRDALLPKLVSGELRVPGAA